MFTARRSRAASSVPARGRRVVTVGALAAAGVLMTAVGASASPAPTVTALNASAAASSSAPRYHFQTLNDQADPTFNQLLGVNDHGVLVGYFGSGAPGHPNKGYSVLPPYGQQNYRNENFPGSMQTQVVGINNKGTTVGFWVDTAGNNFGFVARHGQFTNVINPATGGGTVNQLLGVNNHEVAVGFYSDPAGNSHGYTYDIKAHRFTPVNVPGATSVVAAGINDAGHVTGFAVIGGTTVAFLLKHHSIVIAQIHGSANTQALGVNNADQVVGSYVDHAGKTHGFVATNLSKAKTVDDPNGIGTTIINGINNRGNLVGFYTDLAGNTDGFLARR